MAYMLTEAALELLGCQFYDIDGEPCNISLESDKGQRTEGATNLKEKLGIKFSDSCVAAVKPKMETNIIDLTSTCLSPTKSTSKEKEKAENFVVDLSLFREKLAGELKDAALLATVQELPTSSKVVSKIDKST